MKLSDPESPPKNPPIFKSEAVKKRYSHAKAMAGDAASLPKIERQILPFIHLIYGLYSGLRNTALRVYSLANGEDFLMTVRTRTGGLLK